MVIPSLMFGQGKGKPEGWTNDNVPARVTGSPTYAVLNINNISSWMRYDGHSNHSPSADDGTYYPRNIGSVIYQDCLVWGGKAFTDAARTTPAPRQHIRVGGGTYGIGTRAGRILQPSLGHAVGSGVEDPQSPDVRIFRIRRDYYTMSHQDLMNDAASVNEISQTSITETQMYLVRAQYAKDWSEWPVAKGAPYIDRNGNGIYDPPPPFNTDPLLGRVFTVDSLIRGGYDEPGIAGVDPSLPADQVIWTVYHDLTPATALSFAGSEPLGLEVQKTMWGYRRTNALGNLYFVRFRLINKGGVDTSAAAGDQFGAFWIDSMYVAQWSDPDLGNAGDDLVGCDTLLGLGFCYNGNAIDEEFRWFNLPPPAVGYDFLAGAVVPDPGHTGIVNLQRRDGVRNLQASSFSHFSAGSPYTDPPTGVASYLTGTGRWWKLLRGFAPLGDLNSADQWYATPAGIPPTKFPVSGDPVRRQGWNDGDLSTIWGSSGDRRMILSSGPFSMAPGDTQEVYVGVVAGIGSDRLSSITVLKYNDQYVQSSFDRVFAIPRAPSQPLVAATALDREIVLEWGSDPQAVRQTETQPSGHLAFEGYVVYELPTAGSTLTEGVRLATYDLKNSITRVTEPFFDPSSATLLERIVQEGSDAGIQRTFRFSRSYLYNASSGDLLYNGKEYHLAVTAYNVNTQAGDLPRTLESEPVVLSVKPRVPFGERPVTAIGDTLTVVRASGSADVRVIPLVIDPLAGRGDTFRVSFNASGGMVTWDITNRSTGSTVIAGQSNVSGDEAFPIVQGTLVKVDGSYRSGLKPGGWGLGDGTSFNLGTRMLTWANGDGLSLEEFNGAAGWTAPVVMTGTSPSKPVPIGSLSRILLRFVAHGSGGPDEFRRVADDSASYAYRFVRDAAFAPAQPSFAPWIANTGSGWRFQDYRISMPLAAYDLDANPPARLAVAFSENNTTYGLVDGYYWPAFYNSMPTGTNNTFVTGPMEWLFVLRSPYTGATPNSAWQDIATDTTIPVMYTFTWNRRTTTDWVPPLEVQFTPWRLPTDDAFDFVVPSPAQTIAEVRSSIDRISVYPNPYYGSREQVSGAMEQSVTFTNLPPRAVIRIFNLAGHLVRTLHKDHPSQYFNWDLKNENGWWVASGMYVCVVELPDHGQTRILKLGIAVGDRVSGVR